MKRLQEKQALLPAALATRGILNTLENLRARPLSFPLVANHGNHPTRGEAASGRPAKESILVDLVSEREPRLKHQVRVLGAWFLALIETATGAPGDEPVLPSTSPTLVTIVFRDRWSGDVVHQQDWGHDQEGAAAAIEHIQSDLERLDLASFLHEYGITWRQ